MGQRAVRTASARQGVAVARALVAGLSRVNDAVTATGPQTVGPTSTRARIFVLKAVVAFFAGLHDPVAATGAIGAAVRGAVASFGVVYDAIATAWFGTSPGDAEAPVSAGRTIRSQCVVTPLYTGRIDDAAGGFDALKPKDIGTVAV